MGFFLCLYFLENGKKLLLFYLIFIDKIGFFIIDYMKILFIKFICINI